jgi:hypothetical protein
MLRHRLLPLAFVPALAGCIATNTMPGYFVYVPPVPLSAFPPPPFPYTAVGPDSLYQSRAPADVQFQTPSLAVRNLAMRISETASHGDCAAAVQAGRELERVDADAHHAILAVDERYARCVRGF